MTQLANTARVVEAFGRTEFVVVVDHFMNDTAELAHLFLPSTTFLEEDDLVVSSYIHSQFQNLEEGRPAPGVEINPAPAAGRGIKDGDPAVVKSPRGELEALARVTGRVPPEVVLIHQGGWIMHGRGVNWLTPDHIPDLGLGTPYCDCLCEVRPK